MLCQPNSFVSKSQLSTSWLTLLPFVAPQVPRYDADKLIRKLRQKCTSNKGDTPYFDWAYMGRQAGICFNAIPSRVSFLNGTLDDVQKKKRAVPQRRQRVVEEDPNLEATKPVDVEENNQDADQLSAVEQSMKLLNKTLKKRVDETYRQNKKRLQERYGKEAIPARAQKRLKKQGASICAMQYLLNPDSFTQTVENIFHFSFLIKNAKAWIDVRHNKLAEQDDGIVGEPGPIVKYCDTREGVKQHPTPKQAIATLTMKDWRNLCEAYGVQKGDLPHRTGSKFEKRRES